LRIHLIEPVSADNPLLRMDNVVLTPHLGSASVETRTTMAVIAAQNIEAALKGETPPNLVNKELAKRHGAERVAQPARLKRF
jgi:lactate dehydrogenase-like 2-hydroxyacid dehydrogenase